MPRNQQASVNRPETAEVQQSEEEAPRRSADTSKHNLADPGQLVSGWYTLRKKYDECMSQAQETAEELNTIRETLHENFQIDMPHFTVSPQSEAPSLSEQQPITSYVGNTSTTLDIARMRQEAQVGVPNDDFTSQIAHMLSVAEGSIR